MSLVVPQYMPAYREKKLREWNDALDQDANAIDTIERGVIRLHETHRGPTRKKLYEHRVYIENNKDRMRYAELRDRGLPVGSRPTEGACKSPVKVRAKGCGQRWLKPGLQAVLTLRGLEMSERLQPAFQELARDYTAIVKRAA